MREEESGHRTSLIETYRVRFGEHIPLIRRQDVKGFVERRPFWLTRPLKIAEVRKQAEMMELETRQFYQKAMTQVRDAGIRKLLGDLEEVERKHQITAEALEAEIAADRPTGIGRTDGWIRIHAGSGIRRRICYQEQLGRVSGRIRGIHRGWNFDGVRGGAVG